MSLHLHNSLTRRLEPFAPLDPGCPTMYLCGPTVYNYVHIGNARGPVVFDVLARLLRRRLRNQQLVAPVLRGAAEVVRTFGAMQAQEFGAVFGVADGPALEVADIFHPGGNVIDLQPDFGVLQIAPQRPELRDLPRRQRGALGGAWRDSPLESGGQRRPRPLAHVHPVDIRDAPWSWSRPPLAVGGRD